MKSEKKTTNVSGLSSSCLAHNYISCVTYLSMHEMLWHEKYKEKKIKVIIEKKDKYMLLCETIVNHLDILLC